MPVLSLPPCKRKELKVTLFSGFLGAISSCNTARIPTMAWSAGNTYMYLCLHEPRNHLAQVSSVIGVSEGLRFTNDNFCTNKLNKVT